MQLRLATRKSQLALAQANIVAQMIKENTPSIEVVLVQLSTRGDEILDRSLQKIGGKALFTKELEQAILEDRADFAVHSMKDVASELPSGLCLTSICERAAVGDVLVSRDRSRFMSLPPHAKIGTSSLRREVHLYQLRQDIKVLPCRGNVNSRLAKCASGEFDAIVLAQAGLDRLGLSDHISQTFSVDEMLPAPGQGAIGIECRADDTVLRKLFDGLNHTETWQCVSAERSFNHAMGGSCQVPIAAHAVRSGRKIYLRGMLGSIADASALHAKVEGDACDYEQLGRELAAKMFALGAGDILQEY